MVRCVTLPLVTESSYVYIREHTAGQHFLNSRNIGSFFFPLTRESARKEYQPTISPLSYISHFFYPSCIYLVTKDSDSLNSVWCGEKCADNRMPTCTNVADLDQDDPTTRHIASFSVKQHTNKSSHSQYVLSLSDSDTLVVPPDSDNSPLSYLL